MRSGVLCIDRYPRWCIVLFLVLVGWVMVSTPAYSQAMSVGDGPPKPPEEAIKELDRQIRRMNRRQAPQSEVTESEKHNASEKQDEKTGKASENTGVKSSEVSKDTVQTAKATTEDVSETPKTPESVAKSVQSVSQQRVVDIRKTQTGGMTRPLLITVGIACVCGALVLVLGSMWLFGNRDH